jgi:hypothetical protein
MIPMNSTIMIPMSSKIMIPMNSTERTCERKEVKSYMTTFLPSAGSNWQQSWSRWRSRAHWCKRTTRPVSPVAVHWKHCRDLVSYRYGGNQSCGAASFRRMMRLRLRFQRLQVTSNPLIQK